MFKINTLFTLFISELSRIVEKNFERKKKKNSSH